MQAHVFAEASNTTANGRDRPIKESYEGLFGTVAGLHEELAERTDARLHVLSEEHGVARGAERTSAVFETERNPLGREKMVERARAELRNAAANAGVLVVLFSTDVFRDTVDDVWDQLVETAKPESVWRLGAARSSLDRLDFEGLTEKGCTVLTYKRVGVARIGTETREELLEAVNQKVAQ